MNEQEREDMQGDKNDFKEEKKSRGIPKAREVFRFLGTISIATDGTQWILTDGSARSYFTSLDSLFMKVISLHLHRLKKDDANMIRDFSDLLKRGWIECKNLAKSIEEAAAVVHGSVRNSSSEEDGA